MGILIELEDKGQDFLEIYVDDNEVVYRTEPFQTDIWKGAWIPTALCKIGEPCPIHHPPALEFGQLKYNIISITPHETDKV